MNDTFYSTLNNLQDVLGQELANINFWTNEKKIADYCVSILKYFGHERPQVTVHFSNGAFEVSSKGGTSFYIEVPKIPICKDDVAYRKQIYARSLILRHELGHALFSNTRLKLQKLKENDCFDLVFRTVEDSRVEALFSGTLKGAKVGFTQLDDVFFNTPEKIEKMLKPTFSAANCLTYFMLRSKEFSYEMSNKTVEKYEELFQKYSWVLTDRDTAKVYDAYVELAKDIETELAKNPKHKLTKELEKALQTMADTYEDVERRTEVEVEVNEDVFEKEEDEEEEKSEEKSEEESEEDADDVATAEEDLKRELSKPPVNPEDMDEEEHSSMVDDDTDSNDQIVQKVGGQDTVDDEDGEEGEGEEEEEDEIEDDEDGDEVEPETAIGALTREIQASYVVDFSDFFGRDFDNYNFDPNTFCEASSINIGNLFQITRTQMYDTKGALQYNRIVHEHRKQINEIVRYLSLKLQNRNRSKSVVYQEEGELDQDNLKELLINPDNPRAFMRVYKQISAESRIIFLIDASGSMNDYQLVQCIYTVILLVEVCKRLNLQYEISFFTSPTSEGFGIRKNVTFVKAFNLLRETTGSFEISGRSTEGQTYKWDEFTKPEVARQQLELLYFHGDRHRNDSAKGAVYVLKSANEKHSRNMECLLGNLSTEKKMAWFHRKFSGGTPEFSSFISVYKRNAKFKGHKIMFVLNDGGYDTDEIHNLMPKTNVDFSFDANSFTIADSNNVGFDFVTGMTSMTEFIIKKLQELQAQPGVKQLIANQRWTKYDDADIDEAFEKLIERWSIVLKTIPNIPLDFNHDHKIPINDENGTQIAHVDFGVWRVEKSLAIKLEKIDEDETKVGKEVAKHNEKLNGIGYHIGHMIDTNMLNDVVYARIINKLRNNGFDIAGFGIQSGEGVHYMGADNFAILDGVQDLKETFSKKLMQVF